jgi:hypothetical protein
MSGDVMIPRLALPEPPQRDSLGPRRDSTPPRGDPPPGPDLQPIRDPPPAPEQDPPQAPPDTPPTVMAAGPSGLGVRRIGLSG